MLYSEHRTEYIGKVVNMLIETGRRRATKYVNPKHVIKATRHNMADRGAPTQSFVVTVGKPNYLERLFIKQALKVKEPFPIRKIQLK